MRKVHVSLNVVLHFVVIDRAVSIRVNLIERLLEGQLGGLKTWIKLRHDHIDELASFILVKNSVPVNIVTLPELIHDDLDTFVLL